MHSLINIAFAHSDSANGAFGCFHGFGMMGGGWGWAGMFVGWFSMVLLWTLLILAIIGLTKWIINEDKKDRRK